MNADNLVYLAMPIDLGRTEPGLVEYAIGELQALGLPSYNPLTAFNVAGEPSGAISKVNQGAMLAATGALAFLPREIQTVGTPAEVSWLASHGKPTAILSDHSTSWVVAGWRDQFFTNVFDLTEAGVTQALGWLKFAMLDLSLNPDIDEQIVFERKKTSAILPTRGYETDAGYDLYASEAVVVPARGQAMVPIGIAVDIPEGLWAQITGRSSTLQKHNLMIAPTVGVIDEGYTGELWAPVVSISDKDVEIEQGQRVAQLILHEAPGQRYAPTWGVTRNKARGTRGFGSTGA